VVSDWWVGWTESGKENQTGTAGPGVSLVPRSNPTLPNFTTIHDCTHAQLIAILNSSEAMAIDCDPRLKI